MGYFMSISAQTIHAALTARCHHLFDQLGEGALVIVSSAPEVLRNGDVHFPYRQYSDVLYLTDCAEPNTHCLMHRTSGTLHRTMACPEQDAQQAQWTGAWTTSDEACQRYGVEQAVNTDAWVDCVRQALCSAETVWLMSSEDEGLFKAAYPEWKGPIKQLDAVIQSLRIIKDPVEQHRMRTAASISAQAHREIMQMCQSDWTEAHVEGAFFASGRRRGADALAYPTIAAGGSNACVLHYTANDAALDAQGLVLLDAGMECAGYAADITRTFPVSGRFSDVQRDLYAVVLSAQTAAIEAVKPGVTWQQLEHLTQQILIGGLIDLGVVSGSVVQCLEQKVLQAFYPHRLGHHLGLDVHDVPLQQSSTGGFEAGQVITIEPGLYLSATDASIDVRWRGMGIRIEDDVCVTAEGCQVLSHEAPKTVEDIEAVMCA